MGYKKRGLSFEEVEREVNSMNAALSPEERRSDRQWRLPTRAEMKELLNRPELLPFTPEPNHPYWTADEKRGGEFVYCVCLGATGKCREQAYPKTDGNALLLIRKK